MQVSFLPESIPSISGWELRARLDTATPEHGDFYDVIDLGHGRFGLLVADVADKGMSAALFMALSRTLLRTYAFDHPEDPGSVLRAANQRILPDTTDDSFVTVFYGLLESDSGRLRYANAGHNPPYILGNGKADPLCNTGMPLGIQNNEWLAREARVEEGELLVLYSDGVTDAHNDADELFGVDRLLHVVRSSCDLPLARLESVVLQAVTSFAGNRTQFDDVTLLLARRLAQ